MSEDPFAKLRAWVDPETGGTLPLEHRTKILELLAERDALQARVEYRDRHVVPTLTAQLRCPSCNALAVITHHASCSRRGL